MIAQIAAGFVAIRRALGLGGAPDALPALNPATAWQLHGAPAAPPLPPRRRRRLGPALVLIALLEIGAVTAGVAWLRGGGHAPGAAGDALLCGSPASFAQATSLGDR